MATYEVKGIFSICLILCVLEGSYFLLFWYNKQIIFTWNEIIYRSIFGIEKIYIETGMMKKCEDVQRVIKEKGYLQVKIKQVQQLRVDFIRIILLL